jgi:hypothetical protein
VIYGSAGGLYSQAAGVQLENTLPGMSRQRSMLLSTAGCQLSVELDEMEGGVCSPVLHFNLLT